MKIRNLTFQPRLETLEQRSVPSAGSLDPTFAGDGSVTTSVRSLWDYGRDVTMQADGKMVVAGSSTNPSGSNDPDFAVVRFNSDGSLDNSFGSGGKVTTDFNKLGDAAYAIAVQSDGKIVVGGNGTMNVKGSSVGVYALVRYNTNGTLDNSFGTKGKVQTDMGLGAAGIRDITLLAGGKILASGAIGNHIGLARYNANGTLDTTFGSGGKVITSLGIGSTRMAMQTDGKMVVVSSTSTAHGSNPNILTARFNANGTLDSTFGSGGVVTWDYVGDDDYGTAVTIQSDGNIVVAGTAVDPSVDEGLVLLRYNNTGSLDAAFGSGGVVWRRAAGHIDDMTMDSHSRIVGVGAASSGAVLWRFNTDGSPDTTFDNGGAGSVSVVYDGYASEADALTFQADGKIVVAGSARVGNYNDFGVARFLGDTATGAQPVTRLDPQLRAFGTDAALALVALLPTAVPDARPPAPADHSQHSDRVDQFFAAWGNVEPRLPDKGTIADRIRAPGGRGKHSYGSAFEPLTGFRETGRDVLTSS